MKRILIFSTAYHPFIGGAEVAVKEITDRLSTIEFDMITANLDGKQKPVERIGNVTVYRIGKGKLSKFRLPFAGVKKALALNREHSYTATWAIMASQAGIAAARFKNKEPTIPMILTVQEGDEESYLMRYVFNIKFLFDLYIKPWHELVFKRADKITAISTHLANRAQENGAHTKAILIPNGADTKLFTQVFPESELNALRQSLGKKSEDIFLITTSRLVEKNAVTDIIQALTLLPAHIKLIILGIGELERDLKKQVETLNLEDRVIFLGQVAYKDIPKYLKISDIFIRPSVSEGMGNSFIEAMAAGIPVIATPVGGIPDFLKNNETGLFCEVKNPQSIATAVTTLLQNKPLHEKIVSHAQKMVISNYDWDLVAQRMKDEIFARV